MKKAKALMAILTALTMTVSAVSVTAYAEETQTAAAETEPRTQEGTFKDGAEYCYVKSSGTLVIDGEGSFTLKEYNTLVRKLSPNIVILGRKVVPPKDNNIYKWFASITSFTSDYTVLGYKYSDFDLKYKEMQNKLEAQATKENKTKGSVTLLYMFPFEDLGYYTKSDPRRYFDFSDAVLEKGKKMSAYFVENGVSERTAKKVTAMYMLGLQYRIRAFDAYPDGRERNEETEKEFMKDWLKSAKYEDELLEQLTEDGLTFDNATSYITEKGYFLTKKHNSERMHSVGTRLGDSFTWLRYGGERPQDLIDAEEADDKEYETRFIPPDDADPETVLEYRGNRIRAFLKSRKFYEPETIDETVELYLVGLQMRMDEGLANKNGTELNDETFVAFIRICNDYADSKDNIIKEEKGLLSRIERYEAYKANLEYDQKKCDRYVKQLMSDYTVNTEDSKKKYINSEGDYVEYYDITENEGTLPDGIKYRFYPATGGIFIDGDALFSKDDVTNLEHFFDIKFYVMGKNVGYRNDLKKYTSRYSVPDDEEVTLNMWLVVKALLRARYNQFFTVPDSVTVKEYDQAIDYQFENQSEDMPFKDKKEVEEKYPLNILKDEEEIFKLLNGTEKAVPDGAEVSLRGDADEDGQVGLSDIIAVAKFTSNSSAYPLKSDTAKANADMNGDTMIDSRDLSMLIESQLHHNKNEVEV